MTQPPLDELYFTWLYSQVGSTELANPTKTYWTLLRCLYTTEFIWFVPNDDNRKVDGRALRDEFLEEAGIVSADDFWMQLECSILEMLIGLSRRLSFEAEGSESGWFWRLIRNLGLQNCTDYRDGMPFPQEQVEVTLHDLMWRLYHPNGQGGLFPLEHPTRDQRNVEIWYQMSAYILERGY